MLVDRPVQCRPEADVAAQLDHLDLWKPLAQQLDRLVFRSVVHDDYVGLGRLPTQAGKYALQMASAVEVGDVNGGSLYSPGG